ncbi:MAG: response regulator [Pseudomonadota bacterium]
MSTRPMPDVLIVDDDDIDVMAVRRALAKANVSPRTHVAHNGEEALALLDPDATSVKSPCIVLLDINMPRMNGFDFLDRIRNDERLHDLVVFMVSTSDAPEDRARAYRYNVAGYINKSLPDAKFHASVNMLVDYCRVVQLPDTP